MDFHGLVSEAAGWTAALLTFLTFSMRSMRLLRIVALSANGCFILYGALAGLWPVLALHAALLPCNYLRLRELDAAGERTGAARARFPRLKRTKSGRGRRRETLALG